MDTLSPEERSRVMSRVKSRDTKPELLVRSLTRALGFGYRLRFGDLPGHPDLIFPGRRKVIFVHGCFWHRHEGCKLARLPKSRREFWGGKLEGNRLRDARNLELLEKAGWRCLVIWECELADKERVSGRIRTFLEKDGEEGQGEKR